MSQPLIRSTPSHTGVAASAVEAMLDYWKSHGLDVHSFMLVRHGEVAAEGWYAPYSPEKTHMLFSLSKSFTSTACAFAFEEGILSPEDYVAAFFPEYAAGACENLRKMKVKHLLSMCTGHKPSADFIFNSDNCVRAFMENDVPCEPGTFFSYNTGATYMCSAIMQRLTGLTLTEYLEPRLFAPLGITGVFWEKCDKGIDYGGFGLNVHTEDIAKLGLLLLNKGVWNGVRLLPESAVEEMTKRRINNCGDASEYKCLDDVGGKLELPEDRKRDDWAQGYGRQIWRCWPENVYRGDGMHGQLMVVMPNEDAVFAATSGVNDIQGVLNGVWFGLLPGIGGASTAEEEAVLAERLKTLSLSKPDGAGAKPAGIPVEMEYEIISSDEKDGENKSHRLEFRFGDEYDVIIRDGDTLTIGHGAWLADGENEPADNLPAHRSAAGGWTSENTYEAAVYYDRTPYGMEIKATFGDGEVIIETRDIPGTDKTTATGKLINA